MAINQPTLQQAGQLQGTTIRKGGQIFQQPISPAGAAALGATADQAKMAGTTAQKKPVLEKAVARPIQQPTIAPRALGAGKAAEEAAQQEKAQQLGQFGGFNERVQKLVQSKFGAVTGVEQVSARIAEEDILNTAFDQGLQVTLPDGSMSTVQDLLTQFTVDPMNETPLVRLSEALGQQGTYIAPDQIKQWIGTGARAIGEEAARTIADQVIMSDFNVEDFGELGFESMDQMATTLDMSTEQFQTLTFGEFQEAVQAKQEAMFTEVETLRSELQNAAPGSAYSQQIQQRIADLTGAGTTVTEQRMVELVEDLNIANQVTIGDRTLTIEEMLKDDNITQMVIDWVNAPEDMKDQIIPAQYGEFKNWVTNQRELLEGLAQNLQETTTQFGVTQESLEGLRQQVATNPILARAMQDAGLDFTGFQTTTDFGKLETEAKKNPIFSLFFSDIEGVDQNTRNAMITALDDESYERLKGKSIDQIVSAWDIGQQILNEPDLADFAGIQGGRFIIDPNELSKVQAAQILLNEIDQFSPINREELKRLSNGKLIEAIKNKELPTKYLQHLALGPQLADERVLALIKAGSISDDNIEDILTNFDERMKAFTNDSAVLNIVRSSDDDELLDYIFGQDVDFESLTQNLQRSQVLSEMGAKGATAHLSQFQQLDVNQDGTIDARDMQSIRNLNLADFSSENYILGGEQQNIQDIGFKDDPELQTALTRGFPAESIFTEVLSLMEDGINKKEALTLVQGHDIDSLNHDWRMRNLPRGFRSEKEYEATVSKRRNLQAEVAKAAERLGKGGKAAEYIDLLTGQTVSASEYAATPEKDRIWMSSKSTVTPKKVKQLF